MTKPFGRSGAECVHNGYEIAKFELINAQLNIFVRHRHMTISLPDSYREGVRLAAAGRRAEAISAFEHALESRPDDIHVLFALACLAHEMNLAKPAEAFYRKVLTLAPNRMEALVGLANLFRAQGRHADAEALLKSTLTDGAGTPELWLTLGSVLRESGNTKQAEIHFRKSLSLRGNYTKALGSLADLLSDRGEYAEALQLYGKVVAAEPHDAKVKLNRAIIHLLSGNFEKGWRDYAARLKIKGKVPIPDHGLPKWNGRFRSGQRLLVTAEQGIGDQIMFASMLPDLIQCAHDANVVVIAECEPRLVDLFARSFPMATIKPWKIENDGRDVRAHYDWLKQAGGADIAIPIGSLPSILRLQISDFPKTQSYLRIDADETTYWQNTFSSLPRPLIGLCWRSGKMGVDRTMHYAPLKHWAEFVRTLPGSIIVAQYDANDKEISDLEQMSGRKFHVPVGLDQKMELDRTAAMLSTCDAVVSAPTAVSWLSASVGVFTCKIVRDPAWTGFGCTYEPFAPAARFAVAAEPGDWPSAFSTAAEMLISRQLGRNEQAPE